MSQIDDNAVNHRSVKLCQLVYDRQIDNEIGFEIRRLLEEAGVEGVLFDFQGQNRNKKTALHLAVEKGDNVCVKFLLQFKPNLEVKDEDGRTPLELARSKGFHGIVNVLLNSSADDVNESYVEVIDYESLTRQKIETIKSRPTFKVLRLINCPSVRKVLRKITHRAYTRTLSESSHLFFIAIETKEPNIDNDQELMNKFLNLRRPMIVQLSSSRSQNIKIYFRDEKKKEFVEIIDTPQITPKEFDEAIQSDDCNMKLLVAVLRSKLLGQCTGNLLDTKLNANESRGEVVNKFARSNALCHRFFKLFDKGQPQIDTIIAALSFKGDQSLLALLDLPFELNDRKLNLNEYQQDVMKVVDCCNYNLLMMAAEQRNLAAVKLLLRCGCDFNHSDRKENRASDICVDVKAFDCLAELIGAGSPYPYNFSTDDLDDSSEAFKRISKIIEVISLFHTNIRDGEIEEVKKFITSHPHIKQAYDINNKCALTVALQIDEVDIYSLLMSRGFEPGVDDEYFNACLRSSHKNEIRKSYKKYFEEAFDEPHLKRLLKMFKLSFGSKDRAKCSTIIRRMFDKLNEIDEVIPILKICSTSDKLKIVFDFNCKSVSDMDPTSGSNTIGVLYPTEDFIYVGAKNHETEFDEVIGTLIHELTHYAMKLTYENDCKPYDVDDIVNTNRFEAITKEAKKICDENPSTDSIVTTVFECYSRQVWQQELIVRVPQLLAHYKMNPKALEAAERSTPELFHFYRLKTLKDVETKSKVFLQKYLISKINKQTETARKIESLNIKFEMVESIDLKPSVNIITSNAPQLTLAMLKQFFESDSHIFVTLEQVTYGNVLDKLVKLNMKKTSTSLIVDCIGWVQKYSDSLRNLSKTLENIKIVALVISEGEGLAVRENFPSAEPTTFTHKWGELTESTKVKLLNKLVNFQGITMPLNKLVDPSSKAMNFFPLSELVDCEVLKIGNKLHQPSHKFYIDSKFIEKCQNRTANVMTISDEAGSGKSVTLYEIAKHLKELNPERCVLFVDLKLHIEAFKSIEDFGKIETFQDFISDHILKNENEFDRELFKEMFQAGKTFVLFDGFDEISPNFKDLLLYILKLFQPRSGNKIYITTRPHLEADLKLVLDNVVHKLEEFSKNSQKSFLREYWQTVAINMNVEHFEMLSDRLLEKFSKISRSSFIGLPLLMRMTAEIFNDPIKENLLEKVESFNVASIFKEFVDKYFSRWKESGSEIARKENVEIDRDGGILEIHHNIAIKHKFGDRFEVLEVDEGDAEKIARVGLIRYDKTKKTFQFIHETFAEYFVADFICFHLNRKNRKPSHDCRTAIEIFIKVLYGYGVAVIQTFLEQILETTKIDLNDAASQSLGKCLSEVVRTQDRFIILCRVMRVTGDNIINLFLSIVAEADQDVLLKMLESRDEENSTALHSAVPCPYTGDKDVSPVCYSTLCKIIATRVDNPKRIFQQTNEIFDNILLYATFGRTRGVFTALVESLNTVFTKDEIKSMIQQEDCDQDNILSRSALWGNVVGLYELIPSIPNYLSVEEMKKLLTAPDRFEQNCLQRALVQEPNEDLVKSAQVATAILTVQILIDFAKRVLDKKDQKLFFQRQSGMSRRNIFHLIAQNCNEAIFARIIRSTSDVLSNDDVKSMLMQNDSEGSNVLHFVTKCSNEVVLKELNSLLRKYLSQDDIRSLLLQVNTKGENCFRLAAKNTEIKFEVFLGVVGNLLAIEDQTRLLQESSCEIDIFQLAAGVNNTSEDVPIESIKFLLTRKDDKGRNAFQAAANSRNVDKWNRLVAYAQARFSIEEVRSFLFDCNLEGENSFHLTVAHINESTYKAVCDTFEHIFQTVSDTFKSVFRVDELKEIVQQKYSDQKNVFHRAVIAIERRKLNFVIEYLSSILSRDELAAMLKQKDSDGRNVLFYLTDSGALSSFISFLKEILSNDEIRNLLLDEDREELTCFQCVVRSNLRRKTDVIRLLSDFVKTILSHDEQRKFFGNRNQNLFHLAAEPKRRNSKNPFALENPNDDMFSIIYECLTGVLTNIEIQIMIQEKDSNGNNPLNSMCQFKSSCPSIMIFHPGPPAENIVLDFFKVLKDVIDADELKDYLTSLSNDGSNCLLLAAKFKDKDFLPRLFNSIKIEVSIDDLRIMILQRDNDGNNIFMLASQNDNPEIFSFVKDFAKEILSEDQIREMLLHENKFNCFQYSLMFQSIDEFDYLCNAIKTLLTHDDQRKLFDNKKHNPLHLGAKHSNFYMFSNIYKFLKGDFTGNEVQLMVQAKDSNGNNILHLICQNTCENNFRPYDYSRSYILLDFSNLLKYVSDADEWKDFLSSSNDDGSNCLLLAAKFKDKDFLRNLFKFIEIELGIDDLRNMIQKHDNDGNSIFMCASHRNLSFVKDFAKGILPADQYKILDDEFTIDKDDEVDAVMETVDDEDVESSNYMTDEAMSGEELCQGRINIQRLWRD